MSFFITFEGTEGCGKSTQLKLLADMLATGVHTVISLREPGGTEAGEPIRELLKHGPATLCPETELLLMNASRAQLVREVIRPALARGDLVLCDRFYDSTTAYQGHGRGLDPAVVQRVIDLAVGTTRPDLTFFLDVPLDIGRQRLLDRGRPDRFEADDDAFFQRVEKGYRAIAAAEPARVETIDGSGSIAAVAAAIWERIPPQIKFQAHG